MSLPQVVFYSFLVCKPITKKAGSGCVLCSFRFQSGAGFRSSTVGLGFRGNPGMESD